MTTPMKAPAAGVHRIAASVESVLKQADRSLDEAANQICRRLLRISPAAAPRREVNDPRPDANLDIQVQRAFKHDKVWAIPIMWWEMALGGVGAATFAASALTGNTKGMAAGWTLGAGGKGILLLLDLGRPERVPLVFAKPTVSWIARGSWAFAVFAAGGAAAIGLRAIGAKGAAIAPTAAAVAASGVVMSYDGFFLNHSAAVSGWESPHLPGLFAATAAVAGASVAGACDSGRAPGLATASTVGALAAAALAKLHLDHLAEGDVAARMSRDELASGVQQPNFVLGGGVLGSAAPAVLALIATASGARSPWWLAATLSSLGVLLGRKAILASGIHAPVI